MNRWVLVWIHFNVCKGDTQTKTLKRVILRIIFSRRFLLFTKTESNYVTFSYRHFLVCFQCIDIILDIIMDYWRHLTGLWGKKTQRDLGEGMLGMLVQCTKDLYAVLTVEALCVLSCVLMKICHLSLGTTSVTVRMSIMRGWTSKHVSCTWLITMHLKLKRKFAAETPLGCQTR